MKCHWFKLLLLPGSLYSCSGFLINDQPCSMFYHFVGLHAFRTQALRRQHLRSTARPDTFGTAHVTLVDSFERFGSD